ncbi:hypothetical protein So717_26630 [Roseobacter cerasinus]|uniref:SciE type virulence protein n=1 Tax=Roseobacter cerasinus TaxID=2602289 RepID=A0A640VU12_9RHOB|nr:type VI secretion system accessory protein TagJ [Roseobacter cerasinus]GFE50910.1 hypothetical protein So717_26630 [Roseobacter cerasinus]
MSVTDTPTLADLVNEDRFDEARAQAVARVKADPKAAEARVALAQLLAIAGDLERAETHARMAQQLAPRAALQVAELRQYLRAMHARAEWWAAGAMPDMPLGPTHADRAALQLSIALGAERAAEIEAAAEMLDGAVEPVHGTLNGAPFEGLRDLDDRLPHALEAFTPGGHYLWLDFSKLSDVILAPLASVLDLVARPARVTLTDGSGADLRLPATYDAPRTAQERLARSTDYAPMPGGLTRAYGQRAFLAGENIVALHDIQRLTLTYG